MHRATFTFGSMRFLFAMMLFLPAAICVGQSPNIKTDILGDPLPQHALLRFGTHRFSPPDAFEVMLSADDRIAVTLGKNLVAWDAETGKLLWEKPAKMPDQVWHASYGCRRLCRMPESGQLVTPASKGTIALWDFATGEKTSLSTGTEQIFKSIDVAPDESSFALGGESFLLVCDRQGEEIYRVENHPENTMVHEGGDRLTFGGDFSYGRFSPNGKFLALVNSENPKTIQILDAASGRVERKMKTTGRVVRFDFSSDNQHIVTTERDIAARLYDLATGDQVWQKIFSIPGGDERYTTDVKFSPQDNLIAVGTAIGEDQRIQLLDPKTGDAVGALSGHTWKPWSLQFTSDGEQLYSTGWDSIVRRWDIEKREQLRPENSERASSVCSLNPVGKNAVFGDDTGKLHLVDIDSGEKLKSFTVPDTSFGQVIFSQDGKYLAGGGSSDTHIHIYVWDLKSSEVIHHWEWPKGRDVHSSVEALSFSKDANRLAAAVFRQSSCYVFDLSVDKQIAKVRHPQVYGLSMRPDGQRFLSAGWDKSIRDWDVETGEEIKKVVVKDPTGMRHDTRMYGVLFSPDGQTIATLELGSTVGLWNSNLDPIRHFKIESRALYGSFQFSRNGLWLAVGDSRGGANIYDIHSGESVLSINEHEATIYNIDFGADDRTLLTGGGDGVCYLWDLKSAAQSDEVDPKILATNLLGKSPRDAFVAYQLLAATPKQAVPAIREAIKPLFSETRSPEKNSTRR